MAISFAEISDTIRTNTHHIEIDPSRALEGIQPSKPHKILVMGTKLAAGTVAELVPKRVRSGTAADGFWGKGSMLAEMVHAGRKANANTEVWGIGIDELTGGTAGTKTITPTGTATAAGTIHLYIGGRYVPVAVASGDAAAAVATAIDTAIKADDEYDRMQYTSGEAAAVVTLTSRWKGVELSDVRVNYNGEDNVPGISIAIATGTPGAGNPDISEIITAIGDVQYDTFIMPWTDATNLAALEAELLTRWGGMVQTEGHAHSAYVDTHANTTTQGNSRNSKHLTIHGGNEAPQPTWIWASVMGFLEAGQSDPARPRQALLAPGLLPAEPAKRWGQSDRDLLLHDGIATHIVDDGGNVYMERCITTYQTNALSIPDPTFLDVETLRTLAWIRWSRRTAIATDFPRHKLMDDGADIPRGQPVVTPSRIRAHGIHQFREWADLGIVEPSAIDQFADEYIVERDPTDANRVTEQMGPNLMNQFRGLSGQVQFIL